MIASHVRAFSEGSQRSSLRSSRSTEDGVKETEARNGFNAGMGIETPDLRTDASFARHASYAPCFSTTLAGIQEETSAGWVMCRGQTGEPPPLNFIVPSTVSCSKTQQAEDAGPCSSTSRLRHAHAPSFSSVPFFSSDPAAMFHCFV